MINLIILDENLIPITSLDMGDIDYPYSEEIKLYLDNQGTYDLKNIVIETERGLSIQNFSTPALIEDAHIINYKTSMFREYYEIIFSEDNICQEVANFPGREITIERDPDGYVRNVIPNIAIKFHHTSKDGNGRIFLSEAKYLMGVSKDIEGVAEGYTGKIIIGEIAVNEQIPFWVKYFLFRNMTAEKNPRKSILLITGGEDA